MGLLDFLAKAKMEEHKFKEKVKAQGLSRAVSSLGPVAIALVTVGIVVSIGAIILGKMENVTDNSEAVDVLTSAIDAMGTFGDFFSVIVIIAVAAIIFLLLGVFGLSANGRGRTGM